MARSSHCGSVVMNPTGIHKDAGSTPGLAQWVKDSALPTEAAQTPYCCGCGVGQHLHLRVNASPGNIHICSTLKRQKNVCMATLKLAYVYSVG